jgi:hypothetical protein
MRNTLLLFSLSRQWQQEALATDEESREGVSMLSDFPFFFSARLRSGMPRDALSPADVALKTQFCLLLCLCTA